MFIAPTEMYEFKVFLTLKVLFKVTNDRGPWTETVLFVSWTEEWTDGLKEGPEKEPLIHFYIVGIKFHLW